MPNTTAGNDALELVKNKVLRGFSVEFIPLEWHEETDRDEAGLTRKTIRVIEKAKLKNIGLVDRPAYKGATVNPRSESSMDQDDVKKLIDEQFKNLATQFRAEASETQSDFDFDKFADTMKDSITETVTGLVDDQVNSKIESALEERDAAKAEAEKAEAEKTEAEEKAEEERQQILADAEKRAELIVETKPLLPEDFDVAGKSVKEILVAAAGDEIDDAESRSEDYLLAKVESFIERRSDVGQTRTRSEPPVQSQRNVPSASRININRIVADKRMAQARQAHATG